MPVEDIPITFKYKGKTYKGHFSQVFGVGANVWHLMINDYYKGQLIHRPDNTFVFYGNSFEDMGQEFGDYMIAYYQ